MKTHAKKYIGASLCILLPTVALIFLILMTKTLFYDPVSDIPIDQDGFFLSMFPIDGFSEEDFTTYEGITVKRSDHLYTDHQKMLKAFQLLSDHAYQPKMIYLGLDPDKITVQQAGELLSVFPDTTFKVFLKYRSILEWKTMDDYESLLSKYQDLTTFLASADNAKVYPFFAEEWIIADANNYQDNGGLKEDVSNRLFLYALFSEEERDCRILPGEVSDLFSRFRGLIKSIRSGEYGFQDLSDKSIIFIGDSVFGNFTDRRSIPVQLHNMSGADTFNCGWGGSRASYCDKSHFSYILDAILGAQPNLLPSDSQSFLGLTEFLSIKGSSALNSPDTVYVLHFGINDYISGAPVETEDPYDAYSLCGAMRAGIERLQSDCPDSRILIVIPNHLFAFERGTAVINEEAGVYENYIEGLIKVANEYHLPYLDDYHQIINSEKQATHVNDGVHPNDSGRFLIAYGLMHAIAKLYQ